MAALSTPRRARFGDFVADFDSFQLHKRGIRLKLQGQPFQILRLLLRRPGQSVTREELRLELWAETTFVDFDAGLNAGIRRLRDALNDSAEEPRFIETLPRHGYRFIAPVEIEAEPLVVPRDEVLGGSPDLGQVEAAASSGPRVGEERHAKYTRMRWAASLSAACLLLMAVGMGAVALRSRVFAGHSGDGRFKSIAVLPLRNLSGDPSQDYFAEGMTDELITNLAQIKELHVISRTSTIRFKGTQKKVPEIARELGVDAVLEGAAIRSGNRVRIHAQLIRGDNDVHLWAKTYDRDVNDILSLQIDLARAIASEIRVQLTPQEQSRLASTQSVNPEGYQFYLRGRYCWNKRTEAGYNKAIEFFQRALAIQPDYAQAYAGLADSYALLGTWKEGGLSRAETISLARSNALRAIQLDDNLAEAHASLASISYVYDWNWPLADKEFHHAIELNPNYATAHHWYAHYCFSRNRIEEGLHEIRLAQQLDPQSLMIHNDVGQLLYSARRYDEAIEEERRTLEMDETLPWPHHWLGLSYLAKRQYAEAVTELQTFARLSNGDPGALALLGMVEARAGYHKEAKQILQQLRALPPEQYHSILEVAWLLAALGDRDEAFAWLEKIYPDRPRGLKGLHLVAFLDPLRADPRFQDLQRRVGLP